MDRTKQDFKEIPVMADGIRTVMSTVSPLLDDLTLWIRLVTERDISVFQSVIGATSILKRNYLLEEDDDQDDSPAPEEWTKEIENKEIYSLFEKVTQGQIDLDSVMPGSVSRGNNHGVDAKHLSNIRCIDHDTENRTLDVTSQLAVRTNDPRLSRNYGTNYQMLRYKRIKDYFFMYTFFATKKAGKSSRVNTCCQIFVTDKGFVCVVQMTTESQVLQAVNKFSKEIGAPDAIISNLSKAQTSSDMKKFCNDIGTTMCTLEENTL